MSKIVTLGAAAVGYVLGARAGREQYERIVKQAQRLWSNPQVQEKRSQAGEVAREKGQQAVDAMTDKASELAERVTKGSGDQDATAASSRSSAPQPTPPSSTGGAAGAGGRD